MAYKLLLVSAVAQVTVSAPQPPPPGQIVAAGAGTYTYKITQGDQVCALGYTPGDHSLLLSAGRHPATLNQIATCLSPLLDAVLRDHPGIPEFDLLLTDRGALVERIETALDSSPAWNAKTGSARHGLTAVVILNAVNHDNLAAELAHVFAKRGYALTLRTASLITVDPISRFGNRKLPTDVADMEFSAKHMGGK